MSSEGRVCVTGGSGFIGSWVIRLLLEHGYTVHAAVKDLSTVPFSLVICLVGYGIIVIIIIIINTINFFVPICR